MNDRKMVTAICKFHNKAGFLVVALVLIFVGAMSIYLHTYVDLNFYYAKNHPINE